MIDKIEAINTKIKEFEEELVKQNDYFAKLTKEAETIAKNVHTLNGAIQGCRISLQTLQGDQVVSNASYTIVEDHAIPNVENQ